MRRIDLIGLIDPPDDAVIDAARQIVAAALKAKTINSQIDITPILRQTLFYVYEGGQTKKWSPKRPHSLAARKDRDFRLYSISKGAMYLRYDHAIPLSIIYRQLEYYTPELYSFKSFLSAHLQGVIITVEEDKRLNAAGYRKSMPLGSASDDLLARYKAVGIEFDSSDAKRLMRQKLK